MSACHLERADTGAIAFGFRLFVDYHADLFLMFLSPSELSSEWTFLSFLNFKVRQKLEESERGAPFSDPLGDLLLPLEFTESNAHVLT